MIKNIQKQLDRIGEPQNTVSMKDFKSKMKNKKGIKIT